VYPGYLTQPVSMTFAPLLSAANLVAFFSPRLALLLPLPHERQKRRQFVKRVHGSASRSGSSPGTITGTRNAPVGIAHWVSAMTDGGVSAGPARSTLVPVRYVQLCQAANQYLGLRPVVE